MSPRKAAWAQEGSVVLLCTQQQRDHLQKGVCAEKGGGTDGGTGAPGHQGRQRCACPSADGDPEARIVFVAALLVGSLRPAGSLLECLERIGRARVVCCG